MGHHRTAPSACHHRTEPRPGTRRRRLLLTALAVAAAPLLTASTGYAAPPAIHTEVGLYGTTDPTYDGVYRQSLAILGLHAAGTTPPPEAVAWLRRQQCADGGFSSYNPDTGKPCPAFDTTTFTGGEDTNATAVAVQALLAVGRTKAAQRAARWLASVQNPDGGWEFTADPAATTSDPNSTGLVLTALTAAGIPSKGVLRSGRHYLRTMQVGRADFDTTPAADRGGIATPWQAHVPDVLATVQAVPALAGADLLRLPRGERWRRGLPAAPSSAPAESSRASARWAATWLGTQTKSGTVTGPTKAAWAVLSFAWARVGKAKAITLYEKELSGQIQRQDPGGNAQAALAAAALGERQDLRRYARHIAASLQRDTTAPTVAVTVPKKPRQARHWKRLRVTATDPGSGVARVRVAVSQQRSGTWYAYTGKTWERARNGHAAPWLGARSGHGDTWRLKLRGLATGKLVVRATAVDAAGNHARAPKLTQRVTARR